MQARSWRWLATRIVGLLDRPVTYTAAGAAVYRTRLGSHFYQRAAFVDAKRALEQQQRNR